MAEKYRPMIRRYCEVNGITVPVGLSRGNVNRYAVIQLTTPPKLVARTWFKQADVIYFLENLADDTPLQILDFKELQVLSYEGGKRLKPIGTFEAE